MKITRLGGTRPLLTIGSIISGGTTEGATESPAPSGQVPTSNGSNGVSWGSNVATITVNGTTLVQGPFINFANGSNTTVTVDQVGSVASNTIRIHATGGAGSFGSNSNQVSYANAPGASTDSSRADHVHLGVTSVAHSSNTYSGPVILAPGANVGITSPVSGTFTIHSTAAGGSGGGGGAPTTAKYVTTAVDATLSAELVMPDLAGNPNRLPTSPGGSDMEFDTSTIGGTALGTPTTIDADTTVRSGLYIHKAATAAFGLHGRYWTAPSTPFTMTAWIAAATPPTLDYNRIAIGIAEATPGKTEGFYYEANGTIFLSTISTTTPSTGAAYVLQGAARNTAYVHPPGMYFRVICASSTDITWQFSTDGLLFRTFGTANRNPGFTIGSVFAAVNPENATLDMAVVVGWIRFT